MLSFYELLLELRINDCYFILILYTTKPKYVELISNFAISFDNNCRYVRIIFINIENSKIAIKIIQTNIIKYTHN